MKELVISQSIAGLYERSLERYFTDLKKIERITPDQEVILARRIRDGDRNALNELVRSNLRFVISVAKQFQHQGVGLTDLINEGNLGLITAAGKFDETKGYKFISYAVWWIRQAIISAIAEQSGQVHIPYNVLTLKIKVNKASQYLEQELKRRPTSRELAIFLNIEEEKVSDLIIYNGGHCSIDQPLSADVKFTLLDKLHSQEFPADAVVLKGALKQELESALAILSTRDRTVLQYYFGLTGSLPMPLADIGACLNICAEHTRRVKDLALEKIRLSTYGKVLQAYL